MGSEYWRMNARQRGSALPAASALGPNRPARDAASAELRPCRGSASSARSTSSALSVCHATSGASAWRSAPGTSLSLVCTGHPPPGKLSPRRPESPPVDLGDRVGVVPQGGRAAAVVAEAGGGVAQVEAAGEGLA